MVERKRAVKLWILCTVCLPVLCLMQLLQGLFGSVERSINMACSLDTCGNALFGGDYRQTISERVGVALIEGERWAKIVAPCIDYFFGPQHCLDHGRAYLACNSRLTFS